MDASTARECRLILDDGVALEYEVTRRKGKRTVTIRISPDGRIKVSAPYSCSLSFIEDVVRAKSAWIAKARRKLSSGPPPWTGKGWTDGTSFFLHGRPTTLCIEGKKTGRPEVLHRASEDTLLITVKEGFGQNQIERILKAYFKSCAVQFYEAEVLSALVQTSMKNKDVRVKITSSRSRWGSCSSQGTICFSLRTMVLPEALREYLVLHEVAHLVHMNHGAGFKAFLTAFMPDWRTREKEMQSWHGASLAYTS